MVELRERAKKNFTDYNNNYIFVQNVLTFLHSKRRFVKYEKVAALYQDQ